MKDIGGYFELELRKGTEYHPNALALNTGRNALELILRTKKIKKVYIPYYTCDVVLEPLIKLNIEYDFYHINTNFEPVFDFSKIEANETFLYTNYFGLKDDFIEKLAIFCPNLIIDSTQSFFSKPILGISTFYSCRKFFGVPDGAYLYLDNVDVSEFRYDYSDSRFAHLLKRIEHGAGIAYNDFKTNDSSLIGQPILQMSKLTKALLGNIDYENVKKIRRENFKALHRQLSDFNQLKIKLDNDAVPMVYPFWSNNLNLRQLLIANKVFVATYWPNVLDWCDRNQLESRMVNEIVFLPVDQRYEIRDLQIIINLILL